MRQLLHATTGPPQPFTPSERAILAEWAQEQTLGAWHSPAGRIGWMMKFGEEARELIDRLWATVQAQEAEIARLSPPATGQPSSQRVKEWEAALHADRAALARTTQEGTP